MNITLFVYGTLKRGFWNHNAFCMNAVSIEEATVRGRLYELPSGIPMLEVPDVDIMAEGTYDLLSDARTQATATASHGLRELHGWHVICGEILVFENPFTDLPPIDRLEGFRPGRVSLYRRVLLPVIRGDGKVTPAWCYVASHTKNSGSPTGKYVWP